MYRAKKDERLDLGLLVWGIYVYQARLTLGKFNIILGHLVRLPSYLENNWMQSKMDEDLAPQDKCFVYMAYF